MRPPTSGCRPPRGSRPGRCRAGVITAVPPAGHHPVPPQMPAVTGLDHDIATATQRLELELQQMRQLWRGRLSSARGPSRRQSHLSESGASLASSHDAPADAPRRRSHHLVLGAVQAVPRTLNVTIICVNRCGFLQWIASQGVEAAQGLLQAELDRFAKLAAELRGIVDTLCGDHFRASFNAARPCATRGPSAAKCASAFARREESGETLTSAVCSGQFVCGDFGSTAIVRFMLIGRQYSFLTALERMAASWRISVLADGLTHSDLSDTWRSRMLCAALYRKQGQEKQSMLHEIIGERGNDSGQADEWMYELEALGKDPWDVYNTVMRLWLGGAAAEAKARAAAAAEDSPSIADALRKLMSDIDAGRPPPRRTLYEALAVPLEADCTSKPLRLTSSDPHLTAVPGEGDAVGRVT
eukprot:TRINITY_DN14011_c0_g5_i1.p2 TRINITY_DN14011_c0_g5~~TRINITY_DN14011_c0_g5_i1.p2  ORF type:complete len:414 (+),score=76.98 TRINITY_DN14011_c0_g5_i1:890-2131(+)